MTLKSRVAAVRREPEGAYVSYGRTARLDGARKLAVIPIGYADGFSRLLSNKGSVLIRGIPAPIVGRVCMDMCMVEAGEDVRPGDEAEIFGESLPAEESAGHMGTVQYELLCAVSPRVPRVYREE